MAVVDNAEQEFNEVFWPEWPNKKAKIDGLKAFRIARKKVELETIMKGVATYKANKEEWRAWMLAGTFLRGERWEDEYGEPEPPAELVAEQRDKLERHRRIMFTTELRQAELMAERFPNSFDLAAETEKLRDKWHQQGRAELRVISGRGSEVG